MSIELISGITIGLVIVSVIFVAWRSRRHGRRFYRR